MTRIITGNKKAREERRKTFDERCRSLAGPVTTTFIPSKENNMATDMKTITTRDTNSGLKGTPNREVHFIKVLKGTRQKVSKITGAQLYDHLGHDIGDFHLTLVTRVNGRDKTLNLEKDDVVFTTGTSKRFQVLTKKGFNKRFPDAKLR